MKLIKKDAHNSQNGGHSGGSNPKVRKEETDKGKCYAQAFASSRRWKRRIIFLMNSGEKSSTKGSILNETYV